MKLVTVVGARPQFVKAAVVSRAIAQHNLNHPQTAIQEIIVHTGQHYDHNMSDVFFKDMQIPHPQHNLGIGGSSHGAMTGQMLEQIEGVLLAEQPDVMLVYGDTNSTLAGALAAAKLHIPIAHVEAGLRSFNMRMPEEINRILTDQVSRWLFCPTETAVQNLEREGFASKPATIANVGDVMYDAALFYQQIAQPSATIASLLEQIGDRFCLATLHRSENTDDPDRLTNIIDALEAISETAPVVLPLHPRTRKLLGDRQLQNIRVLDPVGYFDMITLLTHCKGVLTDSGGLQKEAYFFHKPCITLRDETEWVELVQHGFNTLVGADTTKIQTEADRMLQPSASALNYSNALYGNGNAGQTIIQTLLTTV